MGFVKGNRREECKDRERTTQSNGNGNRREESSDINKVSGRDTRNCGGSEREAYIHIERERERDEKLWI